jgi:FkbM family methyltransferase
MWHRFKEELKAVAARAGYEVHRRDVSHSARRAAAFAVCRVDVVLDIGANEGQYVRLLREFGYQGRIVSFEPLPGAFQTLAGRFSGDGRWRGVNAAVGERAGVAKLQVAKSTQTSSVLTATEELCSRIEDAEADYSMEVPVVALDEIWSEYVLPTEVASLKIDVQGYEHPVLNGARRALELVPLIEIEMALVALYDGGSTIHDLLPRLHDRGFEAISIGTGFVDRTTGQVLDVDVLLGRSQR